MGDNLTKTTYWYEPASPERQVLEAVRGFRRADNAMRDRAAGDMAMGVNDMRALQIVIAAWRKGEPCTPQRLALELNITTASTAKLLNRLSASGHLRRVPNAADARSTLIEATEHAHQEVRARMAAMHSQMREVVARFDPAELSSIARFLTEMSEVFDASESFEPLSPMIASELPSQ